MTTLASSDLNAGSFTPEQRFAGSTDIINKSATVASGEGVLVAGTVLGKVTVGGKLIVCDSGASDGSQVPVAILAEDIDATSSDIVCQVYVAGEFNVDWLTFDASFSTEALKLAAFPEGSTIIVKNPGYSG